MKRATLLLLAAYGVHLLGLLAFWWTWNAAFGVDGRSVAPDLDIPLAYAELGVTGVVATVLTAASIRARPARLLFAPQTLSFFMATTWLWSVLLFESVV